MVSNDECESADVDASRYEVTNDSGAIVTKQYSGLIGDEEDYDRGTAIDTEDGPGEALIYLMGNNPDGLGAAVAFGELGDAPISDFLQTVFDGQTSATSTATSRSTMRTRSSSPTARPSSTVSSIRRGGRGRRRGELTITGPSVDDDGIDRPAAPW